VVVRAISVNRICPYRIRQHGDGPAFVFGRSTVRRRSHTQLPAALCADVDVDVDVDELFLGIRSVLVRTRHVFLANIGRFR
jgi:hypothetical protein